MILDFIKLILCRILSITVIIPLLLSISFAAGNNKVFEKSLDGLNRVEAVIELEKLGLAYDIRRVPDCGIPDTVVGTIPIIKAETSVPSNEVITLKITTKSGLATVPKVLGMTLAAATIELEKNCFQVKPKIVNQRGYSFGRCSEGMMSFTPDGGIKDKIIRTNPKEGDSVKWTSQVEIERYASGSFKQTRRPIEDGKLCP